MTWHVDTDLLERYVAGSLPDAAAWSLETHVTACSACRTALRETPGEVSDARLQAIWADVSTGVHELQRPLVERALAWVGVASHDARLLSATRSLTASWLLGVVLVLGATVAAAWLNPGGSVAAPLGFLLIAPLVPVAGVAVAFGPRVDPAHDLAVVAPMSSWRLLLMRSVAVLASSMVLAGAAALALPAADWSLIAWIVPAFTLTTATLAGSVRFGLLGAGTVVGVGWVVTVLLLEVSAFRPVAQMIMGVLLALSLAVLMAARVRLGPEARL